jgi:hypothetical protein
MAFPHPKSRKDDHRNGDESNNGGEVWNGFKRTINITDDRKAKDDVNPARNRPIRGETHSWLLLDSGF